MKKTKIYNQTFYSERSDQRRVRFSFLLTLMMVFCWAASMAQKAPPSLTGCDAVTLPWGQTVTTSGTYSHLYKNKFGKDSLVTYNVTVKYSVSNVINASFCQGTSFQLPWGTTVSAAGSYNKTYKAANGCDSLVTVNLTMDPKPKTTISGKKFFCPGSSSILDAGSGFSTYVWSTGATTQTISVSNSGTYSVTVSDGKGCTGTASTTITLKAEPKPTIKGKTSFCDGGSTLLTAGGNFSSYLWSTGSTAKAITVNSAGTYTLTVTNAGGCSGTASVNVTVDPNPTPVITGNTPFCPGGSAKLDAGNGYASYVWSTGDKTSTIDVHTAGTFTVTVTNAAGCSGTTSATTTVLPEPKPVISGNLTFCPGKGGTTLDAGAGYASYLWSDGSTSQTINVFTSGNWTVTVTNADGCSGSASATTILAPLPKPSIKGNLDFCPGNSTTLDAGSGYKTYLWSDGSTTQTISVNTAGTWTVTVTNADGCSGSATVNTILNPEPKPAIYGDLDFCDGASSVLTADQKYYAHLWSTGATTQSITVNKAGVYSLTVSNIEGCTGSTSVNVTVNPNPTPVITGDLDFCAGKGTTLDAGAGYASYMWSTGATTQTIQVNSSGSFHVMVTDANGCSGSASASTKVNPNPKPSIKGILGFCPGNSTTLDAGSGYKSYLWSDGSTTQTITVSTAATWTVTVTTGPGCTGSASVTTVLYPEPKPAIYGDLQFCDGSSTILTADQKYYAHLWSTGATTQSITVNKAGVYTLTVSNMDGCTGSASVTVVVNPNPTPVITGDLSFCAGKGTTLDAGAGYASYLWSDGSTTQTINVNKAGKHTVTVTDALGCSGSTSVTTSIDPNPVPSIKGDLSFCPGSATKLDAGSGYASYSWSDGSTTQAITVNTAGSWTVTVTNAAGCSGSTSATTTLLPEPKPTINGDLEICDGESTTLSADKNYSSYLWSTGATSLSISVKNAGTYTLTVTNSDGCSGTASVNVTVNPKPVPVISGDLSFCPGKGTTLDAGAGYSSYMWSTGATTQTISVNNSGTFTVTVTNSFGCDGSATATTTLLPEPKPVITGKPGFCPGGSTVLNAGNGYASYLWSDGSTTQTITVSNAGTYSVTVTNASGCSKSTSISVSVYAEPKPSILGKTSICDKTSTNLSADQNYKSYLWSNGATTSSISVSAAGVYTLTVSNLNGCTGSAQVTVTVNPLPVCNITGNLKPKKGQSTTLCAPAGMAAYLWSNGSTTQCITVTKGGNYAVTITNASQCTSTCSVTVVYPPSAGNSARFASTGMNIYPNPFAVNATIEMINNGEAARAVVEIFSLKGEKVMDVYQGEIAAEAALKLNIDASNLPEGIYVCRMICGEEVINQRLVIRK